MDTGEPIGLQRLLLRPTAALCIEAKERQEQREKHINSRGNQNG
jgi:DnaK suppressor protein